MISRHLFDIKEQSNSPLETIAAAFDEEQWAQVIILYEHSRTYLKKFSVENSGHKEQQEFSVAQISYIQALTHHANHFQEFADIVDIFHRMKLEIEALTVCEDTVVSECLGNVLSQLSSSLDEIPQQLSNETVTQFGALIKFSREKAEQFSSAILQRMISDFQKKLASMLYESRSENPESLIKNLMLAHRLLHYGKTIKYDEPLMFDVHAALYENLRKFIESKPAFDVALTYFYKIIGMNEQVNGTHSQLVKHQRFFITQIAECIPYLLQITPPLTSISLLSIIVERYKHFHHTEITTLDKTLLAKTYHQLGTIEYGTGNLLQAIEHLYEAYHLFTKVGSSSLDTIGRLPHTLRDLTTALLHVFQLSEIPNQLELSTMDAVLDIAFEVCKYLSEMDLLFPPFLQLTLQTNIKLRMHRELNPTLPLRDLTKKINQAYLQNRDTFKDCINNFKINVIPPAARRNQLYNEVKQIEDYAIIMREIKNIGFDLTREKMSNFKNFGDVFIHNVRSPYYKHLIQMLASLQNAIQAYDALFPSSQPYLRRTW